MVRKYVQWSDLIVMDLSNPRAGLLEELEFLVEGNAADKTLFYIEAPQRVGPDSEVTELPIYLGVSTRIAEEEERRPDNQALQRCAELFPDRRVHWYPRGAPPAPWLDTISSRLDSALSDRPVLRALSQEVVPIFTWFVFIKYFTFALIAFLLLVNSAPSTAE